MLGRKHAGDNAIVASVSDSCVALLDVHRNRRFIPGREPRTSTSTFTRQSRVRLSCYVAFVKRLSLGLISVEMVTAELSLIQ